MLRGWQRERVEQTCHDEWHSCSPNNCTVYASEMRTGEGKAKAHEELYVAGSSTAAANCYVEDEAYPGL